MLSILTGTSIPFTMPGCSYIAMYEQPGMVKGIEVPVKIESMLDDEEKAKEFAKNAEKMVKK